MRPSSSGSLSKAQASARPEARKATLDRFTRDIWAPSNQKPKTGSLEHMGQVAAWDIPAIPLTLDVIEKVSASLKEAGYRSARQYFARACREHVLQMQVEVPPEVLLKMRDAIRSSEREDLRLPKPSDNVPAAKRQAVSVVVLCCWFLMRELEIAAIRCKHFSIDVVRKEVALTLATSKTDQQGNLVQRKHQCYCMHVPEQFCPFHTALAFDKIRPRDPEGPLS